MKLTIAAVLTWLTAIPVASVTTPQRAISLHPGETAMFRFENGQAVLEQRGPAEPMSKFDAYVAWRAQNEQVPPGVKVMPPSFIMKGEAVPEPPSLLPDRVQLTFRAIPGPDPTSRNASVLVLENGYSLKVSYHAVMHANGNARPTEVCEIAPSHPGLEYWPYPLDELEISDLQLEPADGQINCR